MSTSDRLARLRPVRWQAAVGALLVLAGCAREAQDGEIQWARTALERNPQLDVIAVDPAEGVFTVRLRSTGEVQVVTLAELAAAPVVQIEALAVARAEPPRQGTQPETQRAEMARADESRAETSRAETERQQSPSEPERAAESAPAAPAQQSPEYTIERSDGQVRVSGPGVSIVSSGDASASAQAGEQGSRGTDPIICEGRRMLHLDGRNVYVQGNAITARGGCELHITNSRISASDTAVVVQDATVHISNSVIEGNDASFSAGDNSRMYLRASTFHGLPRRAEKAVVQDQGGNQWR